MHALSSVGTEIFAITSVHFTVFLSGAQTTLPAITQLSTNLPRGSYYSNPHFYNLGLKVGLMLSHSMLLSNTLSWLTDRLRWS